MYKKLSQELANEIVGKIKSDGFQEVLKIVSKKDAAENNGTFDVVISTDYKDRSGEIIDQEGWDLNHFKNNPVVLWAHDYEKLPIGVATEVFKNEKGQLQARGIFASHEFAQEVRKLYDGKIVRATSVGFIVKEAQGNVITKSELIEFSFVPVPCNPEALSLIKGAKMNAGEIAKKGFLKVKRVVPKHDPQRAPMEEEWDGAAAIDRLRKEFSTDGSGEKDQVQWEKYQDGFAWYNEIEVNDFGSYKLPHHDIVNGTFMTVFRGVSAAMAALNGARGGLDVPEEDRQKIYEHLVDHYKQFEQEPPELKSMEEIEAEKAYGEKEVKELSSVAGENFIIATFSDGKRYKLHSMNKEKATDALILKKIKKTALAPMIGIFESESEPESDKNAEKGAVADEMVFNREEMEKKWENLDNMDNILWAFYDIYFLNSTPASKFPELISEVADLLKALANQDVTEKTGEVAKSIDLAEVLAKHGNGKKNCKYVRTIKELKKAAVSKEEIGAIMTTLQADVDNLIVLASRELQEMAGETGEKRIEKIKSLVKLLNKEIGSVDEKSRGAEPGDPSKEEKAKKKVEKQSVSSKSGYEAHLEARNILRKVSGTIDLALEDFNKKIKRKSN